MKLNTPSPNRVYSVDFPRLDGGLNIRELDYRLDKNESPDMKNLWWQDGVLQCRDGQVYLSAEPGDSLGTGFTCYQDTFWRKAFFHIGDKLYFMDPDVAVESGVLTEIVSGVPENRGTFFRYNDWLFYKNRGGFYKIAYTPDEDPDFTVTNVADEAYTPILVINADPATGSGDLYQPENRLSPKKELWYNAFQSNSTITRTGNGSTKTFDLGVTSADQLAGVKRVTIGITEISPTDYTVDLGAGTITFTTAPKNNADITIVLLIGSTLYKFPITDIDSVDKVIVDGQEKQEGTDYAVDLEKGQIVFTVAPPVTNPPTNNTVQITYSKENGDALQSILDCPYAIVYGGDQNVCIVLGGSLAQPNAFFWNSNDAVSMNPAYFPISYYNLAGDSEEAITGFGKQYRDLIVLKEFSMGKVTYGIVTLDDRDSISMTYVNVNSKTGCDLPWSIQLIENNLVFCNTYQGVHVMLDSSAAYENNVECISRNINGTPQRAGLLEDVRAVDRDSVCSFDDNTRYWLCANGRVYMWDYLLSTYKKPSWFPQEGISAVSFFGMDDKAYHLNASGRVSRFDRVFSDYEQAIEKVYQFPAMFFDTYERLKDVLKVLFQVRSDTDTEVQIQYKSDYDIRDDATQIQSYSWRLSPRNLAYRYLGVQRFAKVAVRRPGCRHIRHFSMRLWNNKPGQDLSMISAQIYFRYVGVDR